MTVHRYLQGYDSIIDFEVRDRALEVMVVLLELDSPRMAARIGETKPFQALLPILTTAAGRNDASSLAIQAFKELAQSEKNTVGLLALQPRLVELASRHLRISRLVWEELFPVVHESEQPKTT